MGGIHAFFKRWSWKEDAMAIVEPATAAETATNNCHPCKLRLDAPPADTVRRARERRAEQAEGC